MRPPIPSHHASRLLKHECKHMKLMLRDSCWTESCLSSRKLLHLIDLMQLTAGAQAARLRSAGCAVASCPTTTQDVAGLHKICSAVPAVYGQACHAWYMVYSLCALPCSMSTSQPGAARWWAAKKPEHLGQSPTTPGPQRRWRHGHQCLGSLLHPCSGKGFAWHEVLGVPS